MYNKDSRTLLLKLDLHDPSRRIIGYKSEFVFVKSVELAALVVEQNHMSYSGYGGYKKRSKLYELDFNQMIIKEIPIPKIEYKE